MTYAGRDYESAFGWIYYLAIAGMVAGFLFMGPEPVPEPRSHTVFGCYASASAPAIILDAQGLQIQQPGFPRIGFHLERLKTGIALTAEAPISAVVDGDHYRFSIDRHGAGRYLNFFNVINGRGYGAFDENALSRFSMLAEDGAYLVYERAASGSCGTRDR